MSINEYRPQLRPSISFITHEYLDYQHRIRAEDTNSTVYEEVPDWYLKKQELEKEKEKVKQQENSQLEFNIPFGWTE